MKPHSFSSQVGESDDTDLLRQRLPEMSREPKDDHDSSGYPKKGTHEGDLGGAITVTTPLARSGMNR